MTTYHLVLYSISQNKKLLLLLGDCKDVLKNYPDNHFDLIVTDPPYGISFMGKDWDKALPDKEVWKECFRVLKEGKLAFIMCSPRQDVLSRMIIALEDAGFRTNYTSIYWSYASGFPKAKNNKDGSYVGFQPKPAVEVILVVSKGKTLTWLDDCRIPYGEGNEKGRFPANLLVSDDVLNDGKITKSKPHLHDHKKDTLVYGNGKGLGIRKEFSQYNDSGSYSRYFDLDAWADGAGKTFPFLICPKASKSERNKGLVVPEKLIPVVDDNIDTPSARHTKFPQVRRKYSEQLGNNHHPTVKPLKLLSYLITLGSREGDLVLDPFVGSGTSYLAATQLNRRCIGIEINPEYLEIAKARVKPLLEQMKLFPPQFKKKNDW